MLWQLVPVVLFGLASIFVFRSRLRPVLRLAIGSAALVYFVFAALTTNSGRAPFVFFALLALGVLADEVKRRKQKVQLHRS